MTRCAASLTLAATISLACLGSIAPQILDGGTLVQRVEWVPSLGLALSLRLVATNGSDVWLAGGAPDATYGLWRSTDGGSSFVRVADVDEGDTVGFGKAAPGRSYPAVYVSAQVAGVRGIFRSDDAGATWQLVELPIKLAGNWFRGIGLTPTTAGIIVGSEGLILTTQGDQLKERAGS